MMLSRSDAIRRRKIAPPVLIAALLGVIAAGAAGAARFMGGHMLEWARVWSIVIAGLLAAAGQMATGALTPAAGATALVVALGAESADWRGVLHLGVGLVLVTGLGEAGRQVILRAEEKKQVVLF